MALIKLTDNEKKLLESLPALNNDQVVAIAGLIRGASYYRFVSEDGFCCASDAVEDMSCIIADFILNAYGIENSLTIRDRDHDDYVDEGDDE
jgi:hypothetical protein